MPDFVKACSNVLPVVVNAVGPVKPESKSLPLAGSLISLPEITVCNVLSLFVHFTVSPVLIVIVFGENPLAGLEEEPLGIETLTVAGSKCRVNMKREKYRCQRDSYQGFKDDAISHSYYLFSCIDKNVD